MRYLEMRKKKSIIRVRVVFKNPSLVITVCQNSAGLLMPIGDLRDELLYPTLTLMMYSDNVHRTNSDLLLFCVSSCRSCKPLYSLNPGFNMLFCRLLIFFKINFSEKRNTIRVSNSLDPVQIRGFVWPDLGPTSGYQQTTFCR